MIIWSSFILDEMAGLRNDALPSCPECKKDPAFLAKNSGVVTSIQGPSGSEPATFGEITSWTITADAATDPAKQFVEYMMTDGYEPWIAIAPEGKIPVRAGAGAGSTEYSDAWAGDGRRGRHQGAAVGVLRPGGHRRADRRHRHPAARWAIPQGQGDLLGAIQGEQPVANAVNEVSNGDVGRGRRAAGRRRDPASRGVRAVTIGGPAAPMPVTEERDTGALRRRQRGGSARAREDRRTGYLLISPTVVIVFAMVVLPILWTVSLALPAGAAAQPPPAPASSATTASTTSTTSSPRRASSTRSSPRSSTRCAARRCAIGLGLLAALALRQPFRGRGLVRACMLLPYVAPVVAATFVWTTMLNPQFGIVNHYGTTLLGWDEPIAFLELGRAGLDLRLDLARQHVAVLTVVLFEAWRSFPFAFLFLTARHPGDPGQPSRRRRWSTAPRPPSGSATSCCPSCCRPSRCSPCCGSSGPSTTSTTSTC